MTDNLPSMSSPTQEVSKPTAYAPGLMVKVRDELWLVTSVTQSVDGYLLKVRGLSDYVRDTTASFYTALDDIEVFDPAKVEVVADHSPGYRTTRLWLETTLRQTPVPLYQEQLSVANQMLMDPLDYQLTAVRKALSDDNLRPRVLIADAVGLAAFVVLGIQIALSLGHGFIIAAVAAVTTGVSGGVMRDILSGRVPLVFREELYASIAVLGTVVYMGLMTVGLPEWIVTIVSVIFVFVTRLLSLRFRWSLPIFDYDEERAAQIDPKDELASFVRTRGRKIPGARRVYRKVRMVAEQAPVRHKRKGNSKGLADKPRGARNHPGGAKGKCGQDSGERDRPRVGCGSWNYVAADLHRLGQRRVGKSGH